MAPRTQPSDDDWRNVEDAKKRKQIQDRLAQRARRQRLREAKVNAKQRNQQDETSASCETQEEQPHVHLQQPLPDPSPEFPSNLVDVPPFTELEMMPKNLNIAGCSLSVLTRQVEPSDSSPEADDTTQEFDHTQSEPFCSSLALGTPSRSTSAISSILYEQPSIPMSVVSAMYLNGSMLGLTCGAVAPAKSNPCGPEIPLTLQPTLLQLTHAHSRWIDRFPFPRMRDNFINLSGLIEEEDLMRDLFLMPSFEITPGELPWDPKAWKIQKSFAEKWGYLFLR